MKSKLARGFTLIELMIVIAIIGILAVVAVPRFMDMLTKAKSSEVKANLGAIATNASAHRAEHETYNCASTRCGWEPEGKAKYDYFLVDGTVANPVDSEAGCDTTNITEAMNEDDFLIGGGADFGDGCDEWSMNNLRELANPSAEVAAGEEAAAGG